MDLNAAQSVIIRTHMAALAQNRRANAIELESGPGVGKSTMVEGAAAVLARETNEPVGMVIAMMASYESPDVRGFGLPAKPEAAGEPYNMLFTRAPWFPKRVNMKVFLPDGSIVAKGAWDGPLPRIGIMFLDEWGQAPDEVKKPAAELMLHGEVGETVLPVGWRVLAASNRMSDRAGVVRPLAHVLNRRMLLTVDAMFPAWEIWVNAQPAPERPSYLTISFARKHPDLVFRDAVPAGVSSFCTPRSLVLMDRDLRALRSPEEIKRDILPTDQVAREACAGWIGQGETAQFFTHLRYADMLPDIEDIERNPARAKCPDARDAQMVVAYMLSHHVNDKNAEKILEYIGRLHIEMQVLAVRTVTAQNGASTSQQALALANTTKFVDWLARNQDVLIASKA